MNKKVFCPNCNKEIELTATNQYRPFCSKRCRLIDLGEWVSENYTISESSIENEVEMKPIQKH